METNGLIVEIVRRKGLLVGSRAWAQPVAQESDYDYVITASVYSVIKEIAPELVNSNINRYADTGALQTQHSLYIRWDKQVYNILVIRDSDMELYKIMAETIADRLEGSSEFRSMMLMRPVRKLVMQSTLMALRKSRYEEIPSTDFKPMHTTKDLAVICTRIGLNKYLSTALAKHLQDIDYTGNVLKFTLKRLPTRVYSVSTSEPIRVLVGMVANLTKRPTNFRFKDLKNYKDID